MIEKSETKQKKCIFFLRKINEEIIRIATEFFHENNVKILERHGDVAFVAQASDEQIETAYQSSLFSGVYCKGIKKEHLKKLLEEQQNVAKLWNFRHSEEYKKVRKDLSEIGKSWRDEKKDQPGPQTLWAPEDFKEILFKHLNIKEDDLFEKYGKSEYKRLKGEFFVKYEKELARIYKDETVAYHLARIAYSLDPIYYDVIKNLPHELIEILFLEPSCWKMEGEISVGIIFVESSREDGPKFSSSERNTLQSRISDGLGWLAEEAPMAAHLTWVFDWQFVNIDVANGTDNDNEAYWRDPAMGEIEYYGNTYSTNWSSVASYREDLRSHNRSQHAIVIFVTPYANDWHAYASGGRLTLARRNNWGGWGINTIDMITAHEVCHLFGASDEYTGSGTPCSSCNTTHGCYTLPNGNCGACAKPFQNCVMDGNQKRICAYTQGHIGWADLFVELTTADVIWAGTDDNVFLDIGDRSFVLDTPNHDDRERGNVEGYALNYTGITKSDIKRVGIRKSPDGFNGGWKLKRVRVWCRGELICDKNNINQWLEDDYRWWVCDTCGASSDIVNKLRVDITTANVSWAGTDDNVRIYLGGRSWNLDNDSHDDFEKGNTDTFKLDPGTSLYGSMISSIRIYKSPDGIAGGWKLKGLKIYVNDVIIYNNQTINKWLEDNDRNWFGSI